jgi:hypothetical protein
MPTFVSITLNAWSSIASRTIIKPPRLRNQNTDINNMNPALPGVSKLVTPRVLAQPLQPTPDIDALKRLRGLLAVPLIADPVWPLLLPALAERYAAMAVVGSPDVANGREVEV